MALQKRMLDTRAAAEYCGLGKSTLDKFRLTGGGPIYHKLSKRVAYHTHDLDAWIATHRRASTSEAA